MQELDYSKVIDKYHKIMYRILLELKRTEIVINSNSKKRSEDLAEEYFKKKGYTVYKSRVIDGYRTIGSISYWKDYNDSVTDEDKEKTKNLLNILGKKRLMKLAELIKIKSGCPDLMIIKGDKIQFVEVKTNNEEIKMSTCEWVIKSESKYPIRILRVKR